MDAAYGRCLPEIRVPALRPIHENCSSKDLYCVPPGAAPDAVDSSQIRHGPIGQQLARRAIHDADGILALSRQSLADTRCRDRLLAWLEQPLIGFVRRRITNAVRAEEDTRTIVHDALMRITSRLARCRAATDRQFMAWALAITRNVLADYWRSERLSFSSDELQVTINCAEAFSQWAAEVDGDAGDGERGTYAELRSIVCAVYDTLPPDMAQLCWEHIIYGATWAESGRALGVSPDAAKHRYMRAVKTVRTEVFKRVRQLPDRRKADVVARLAECGWAMD